MKWYIYIFTILYITSIVTHGGSERDFINSFDNISMVDCDQKSKKILNLLKIHGERIGGEVAFNEFSHLIFGKYYMKSPKTYFKCLIADRNKSDKSYKRIIWIRGGEIDLPDFGVISINELLKLSRNFSK